MSSQPSHLATQLATQLANTKNLHPTQQWLTAFMSTQKPTTPLPALTQTALFRLLSSDITTSLASDVPNCILPPDIHNVNVKECRLQGPVVVQLLGIEDMSKSRWEQIEAIEALERGEGTKGREIIRVTATEADDDSGAVVNKGGGPHKLSLQDARGTGIYGIELRDIKGVRLGMSIGCKMVLKNLLVARGVLLMEPANTTILGGKIEALHRAWKENRKVQLKAEIEASERTARSNP
ncbi:MAG: hypothetical protein L6R38_005575 [Xanthoria sp. 2 TBL-2021]|nr:MAG: hypothetical protein L6R38_005575 [Xanthoria sp. 2 TBL-2021]